MDISNEEIAQVFRKQAREARGLGRDQMRQLVERAFAEDRETEEFARQARLCRGIGRERMLAIVDEVFM